MGQINNQREIGKARGHLRLYSGAKNTPSQTRLTLGLRVQATKPTPPHQYLDRAQALLDQQAHEASSSHPHLMTIAEFAEYCRVSVRRVKTWIRQGELTADNGLRGLPDGDKRIDLSVWERQLRDIIGPAILATHALSYHALLSVILHAMRYGIISGRLV